MLDEATGSPAEPLTLPPMLLRRRRRLSRFAADYARRAAAARRTHDDLAQAWALISEKDAVDVVPFFGRGHPTSNRISISARGQLSVTKQDPEWRPNVGWAGDGTVPAVSGIPSELGDTRAVWRGVSERHGDLAVTSALVDPLRSYDGDSLPTRGDQPPAPWLGIDMEDVVAAGEPIAIGIRPQPEGTPTNAVHAVLSTIDQPHKPFLEVRLTWDSSEQMWRGVLPPAPEGVYWLSVQAALEGLGPVFAGTAMVCQHPDPETPTDDEAEETDEGARARL